MRNSRQSGIFPDDLQELLVVHMEWTLGKAFFRVSRRHENLLIASVISRNQECLDV